jgi:hypothetical protein
MFSLNLHLVALEKLSKKIIVQKYSLKRKKSIHNII